ncbi:MAG: energy-coupling factor transporter ATPase [Chloroflexi bacterium]|nr:energy-coupling factor transporter ATPase [Chloroflexota bacterium]
MTEPLIRVQNISYTYPAGTGRPALRDVSLTVNPGEYVAIVGANGSGKSTLARHLNALLVPDDGDVWVNGWNTRDRAHIRDIRRTVGMVFQVPDNQIVATIVEDDVAFGPENLGVPDQELPTRVAEALAAVGLEGQGQRASHLLSAGQKQRLAIAAALAMKPLCLVLDEATAMLDPAGKAALLDILRRLHDAGTTIIAVTHSMSEAVEADRIVVLSDGQIVAEGSPARIFGDAALLEQCGLEAPPVARLAHRLAHHWPDFPTDILDSEALADAVCKSLATAGTAPRTPAPADEASNGVDLPSPTVAAQDPWIALDDVHYTYLQGTPLENRALRGVHMEVGSGETVAIIGPTGSGKSTLLQHLNGLLRPHSGRVRVLGYDLADPRCDVRALRKRVGLVFQQPEAQLFERYAGDDVAFGPLMFGASIDEARERVRDAMNAVGLPFEAYKDRLTLALSGGERRRLALAGVLALAPQILALDEPTAGLDPKGREDLIALLQQWRRADRAIVFSSHNMDDVALLADRVYIVADGQIAHSGPTRQVFANPDWLAEFGLGLPSATALAHALALRGCPVPTNVLSLEELAQAIVRLADERVRV